MEMNTRRTFFACYTEYEAAGQLVKLHLVAEPPWEKKAEF